MADGRVIVPLIRSLHVILGCGPAEPAEGPQPPALLSAEQRRVAARAPSDAAPRGGRAHPALTRACVGVLLAPADAVLVRVGVLLVLPLAEGGAGRAVGSGAISGEGSESDSRTGSWRRQSPPFESDSDSDLTGLSDSDSSQISDLNDSDQEKEAAVAKTATRI